MKTSHKWVLVTLMVGILAFSLSRVIWPDMPGMPEVASWQLPLFIFISALESLLFGFGIGFLLFGWPLVRRSHGSRAAFFAIAWTMVSWWPHDNAHRSNGMNLTGLLKIDYLFHVTLIISALIIADYFWKNIKRARV